MALTARLSPIRHTSTARYLLSIATSATTPDAHRRAVLWEEICHESKEAMPRFHGPRLGACLAVYALPSPYSKVISHSQEDLQMSKPLDLVEIQTTKDGMIVLIQGGGLDPDCSHLIRIAPEQVDAVINRLQEAKVTLTQKPPTVRPPKE